MSLENSRSTLRGGQKNGWTERYRDQKDVGRKRFENRFSPGLNRVGRTVTRTNVDGVNV
jgi:hypothetical protein